jgi:hypothetical protein
MKRTLLFSAILFCLSVLLQSCTKQAQDTFTAPVQPAQVITATIAPGQTYIYNAGLTGTMNISRQAMHYLISEATVDSKNGALIYTYVPAVGYKGTDEVTLVHSTTTSSYNYSGCQGSHNGPMTTNNVIIIKMNIGD